ncbi:MAG TPA: hypothetical protein VEB59_11125 [Gemmatimonadales bacterium]|nr:hypothetical protein [Gemmatimonadales bacterium]
MIHPTHPPRHRARWWIRLALLGITLAAVELASDVAAGTARSAVAEAGQDSTAGKALDVPGL